MRNTFYTADVVTGEIMRDLSGLLKEWGLRGSANDVIRYALHYTAEGHDLKKRSPGRVFKPRKKGTGDGKVDDGQDRRGVADDGAP